MKNIKLLLEYDGTNYYGWQRQPNNITVQQRLEEAIEDLIKEKIDVTPCSRTDAGVHAEEFVCNFKTNSKIPVEKYRGALNFRLPKDIVIKQVEEVNMDFHARYNCRGKTYVYTIINREQPIAIYRNYAFHVRKPLDLGSMKEATKYFIGKKDFAAFRNVGGSVKTTERNLTRLDIEKNGDIIKITVTADGFLYNMVRIIVGTLLDVGKGKIKPEYIEDIFSSKDRRKAGKGVSAQGLCLVKVMY